jgi:hypothetical protein
LQQPVRRLPPSTILMSSAGRIANLSGAQTDRFFGEPITARMELKGQAQVVSHANVNYWVFFYGDRAPVK